MLTKNLWIGCGNVASDPQYTEAVGDKPSRLFFTLACNHRKGDGADFIPIVAFGKIADAGAQYLSKGKHVMIEGRASSYKTSEGGYGISFTAHDIGYGPDSSAKRNSVMGNDAPDADVSSIVDFAKNQNKKSAASNGTDFDAMVLQLQRNMKMDLATAEKTVKAYLANKGANKSKARSKPAAPATPPAEDLDLPF